MPVDLIMEPSVKKREQLFMELYKNCFPAVAKYVSKRGGSFTQAKDVFQDALLVYYEKTRLAPMPLDKSTEAYVFGIVKHLWLRSYKEDQRHVMLKDNEAGDHGPEPQISSSKMLRYLETAGKKCMELLSAFYYEQLSLDEIAGSFGFSGTRSATVQKFKCLEKVRNTVKERSRVYEDFYE